MGKLIDLSVKLIRKYLPDPFVFAIILTIGGIGLSALVGVILNLILPKGKEGKEDK